MEKKKKKYHVQNIYMNISITKIEGGVTESLQIYHSVTVEQRETKPKFKKGD